MIIFNLIVMSDINKRVKSKVLCPEKTLLNRQKQIIPAMPNEASNNEAQSKTDNTSIASEQYTCVMCKQTFNSHNILQKHFR